MSTLLTLLGIATSVVAALAFSIHRAMALLPRSNADFGI